MKVIDMTQVRGLGSVKEIMLLATYQVQNGEYDWEINGKKFFNETESLMIDLVSGNPMSIRADEIYQAREEVIKALQTFYFYFVDKFPQFNLHPRIKKALKK